MAYCGCGTKANKGRWAAVALLLTLAVIFLIVNIVLSSGCEYCEDVYVNGNRTRQCEGSDYGETQDFDDVEGCSFGGVVATSLLFFICAIAATVPCCCMCCCAKPPIKEQQYDVTFVAKPQDQPQGAYYAQQQVYGQPLQAQAAYAPQAYGQAQPQAQAHQAPGPAVV